MNKQTDVDSMNQLRVKAQKERDDYRDLYRAEQEYTASLEAKLQAAPIIETCDNGHKYGKLPDHPAKWGLSRCPHCMAKGKDILQERLQAAQDRENGILEICDIGSAEEFDDALERLKSIKQALQHHEEGQHDSGGE